MTGFDRRNQPKPAACKPIGRGGRPTSVTIVMTTPAVQPHADVALERLYNEHYVRLVRLGVLLLGDVGRAEEVVQDCFVALHQRWSRLEGANLPAYLRRSVVNGCRSSHRHQRVVDRHLHAVPGTAAGADEPVLADARRQIVLAALADLPRRQREVLVLRYYLDLSEREIAQTLGISQGAVKSHASRGAAALRVVLPDLQEES